MNWKPILGGAIFTLGISLLGQLAFVLISAYAATADGSLAFLAQYKEQVWFYSAIVTHCVSMVIGGLCTAFLSVEKHVRNAAIVGVLVSTISLLESLTVGNLTIMGMVLLVLGGVFAALGAKLYLRWRPENPEQEDDAVTAT